MLKRNIKDCFKFTGKQKITMPKEGEYFKYKTYERKIKSPFIIYADFEIILVPEGNGKQKCLIQTNIKNVMLAVMAVN